MDNYSLYAAQFLSFKEHFLPKGHKACVGCGVALAVRQALKALEEKANTIDKAKWQIPWTDEMLDTSDKNNTSLLTIPKQPESENKVLSICFDNESFDGKPEISSMIKNLPAVADASGYVYVATACPSHPFDFVEKIKHAWRTNGSAFIHVLCPCPVGWDFEPQNTVRIGRMAVETRLYPLYEITGGYYRLTIDEPNPRPLSHYIKAQGRFSKWTAKKIQELQNEIDTFFTSIKSKEKIGQ